MLRAGESGAMSDILPDARLMTDAAAATEHGDLAGNLAASPGSVGAGGELASEHASASFGASADVPTPDGLPDGLQDGFPDGVPDTSGLDWSTILPQIMVYVDRVRELFPLPF